MPAVDELAARRAAQQRAIAVRTAQLVALAWDDIDAAALDASWLAIVESRAVGAVVVSQTLAAHDAVAYVDAAVVASGERPARPVAVAAAEYAGTAADGRPLETLLYRAVLGTKAKIASGVALDDALAYGATQLRLFAENEARMAARLSDAVAIAVEPRVRGYVRALNLPSCGRCVLLAGKEFARNAGFDRHPRCDCVHLPIAGRAGWSSFGQQSPESVFASMSRAEQDASFGKANAAAIRAGADVGQVVNASRGMTVPGQRTTSEGMTTRGSAGSQLGARSRLTPAALLDQYGNDPQRFAAALRANGYV